MMNMFDRMIAVESAWGAVSGFPRVRFPRPLAEPDVRFSPHPALHGFTLGVGCQAAQGVAMLPRYRYLLMGIESGSNKTIPSALIGFHRPV